MTVKQFFKELNKLQDEDLNRESLKLIFNFMEDNCETKNFEICNEVFEKIDIPRYDTTVLIGFLTSTYMWQVSIPKRKDYYDKVAPMLRKKFPKQINWTNNLGIPPKSYCTVEETKAKPKKESFKKKFMTQFFLWWNTIFHIEHTKR